MYALPPGYFGLFLGIQTFISLLFPPYQRHHLCLPSLLLPPLVRCVWRLPYWDAGAALAFFYEPGRGGGGGGDFFSRPLKKKVPNVFTLPELSKQHKTNMGKREVVLNNFFFENVWFKDGKRTQKIWGEGSEHPKKELFVEDICALRSSGREKEEDSAF